MRARHPIVIHYVHDMDRARHFYTSVFEVLPVRVATFRDCEGNGFELRQQPRAS